MRPIRTPLTKAIYGAPRGLENLIEGLPFWRADNEFGSTTVYSVWEPTPEERRAIANGANVVLGIYHEPIPPVSLAVMAGEPWESIEQETANRPPGPHNPPTPPPHRPVG